MGTIRAAGNWIVIGAFGIHEPVSPLTRAANC
jgi:hypothetical protein